MRLTIPIKPKATPRPRGKAGQRAYYPADYQAYREELMWRTRKAWADAGRPTVEPPYQVTVLLDPDQIDVFIDTTDGDRHGLRGDLDNYYKGVADALEAVGIIDNDRQIHSATTRFG